jgi:parallel beta-helix repeat protein
MWKEAEMRRVLLTLAMVLGGLEAGVSNARAAELVVDKDKVQCPNAEYTSIQAAVSAAAPGDRIEVCPDLYLESVQVAKTLDIVAEPKTMLNDEQSCLALGAPDPTKDAIVQRAPAFDLQANNIKLEGFVVQEAPHVGINTSSSFSGYKIADNVVQGNVFTGVNLLSSGARESRVSGNCFRSNFTGLESTNGAILKNARIDHNVSTNNSSIGFDLAGISAKTNVRVEYNKSAHNQVGFSIANSTNSSIDHNYSQGDTNGVLLGGSNNELEVSYNTFVAGLNGIVMSDINTTPNFFGPNSNLDIGHNVVTQEQTGIWIIADATFVMSEIHHNDTSANAQYGILLETGSGNTIDHNTANENGVDGILNYLVSVGNFFVTNTMFGNGTFDAKDDNRPSNTWRGNKCNTDSPPGTICGVK